MTIKYTETNYQFKTDAVISLTALIEKLTALVEQCKADGNEVRGIDVHYNSLGDADIDVMGVQGDD